MAEKTRNKAKADGDVLATKKREKVEEEEHVEEREQEAADDDADKGDESVEEESDESDISDEKVDEAPVGERDESTKGVARALGVDVDEENDGEDEADEKAKPNRAERRREEAVRRRAAREGTVAGAKPAPKKTVEADDAPAEEKLPKDKNARAKELLRRRQESASGKRVSKLDTGEMVQDSLARAGSATGKWFREHIALVVGVLLVGVGGTVGFMLWTNHNEAAIASASDEEPTKGASKPRAAIFS